MSETTGAAGSFEIDLPKKDVEATPATRGFSDETNRRIARSVVDKVKTQVAQGSPFEADAPSEEASRITDVIVDKDIEKLAREGVSQPAVQWRELLTQMAPGRMKTLLTRAVESLRDINGFVSMHAAELERLYDRIGTGAAHQYTLILEPSQFLAVVFGDPFRDPSKTESELVEFMEAVIGRKKFEIDSAVSEIFSDSTQASSYRRIAQHAAVSQSKQWRPFLLDTKSFDIEGEVASQTKGLNEFGLVEWISAAVQKPSLFGAEPELLPGNVVAGSQNAGKSIFSARFNTLDYSWRLSLVPAYITARTRRIARP